MNENIFTRFYKPVQNLVKKNMVLALRLGNYPDNFA